MRLISRVVPSPAAKRVVRGALRFGLEFAGSAVNMLLFPLARHVTRNPVRWVFGHQDGQFAGNPKYLFLWILGNSRIRAVWITGNWHTYRSLKLAGFPVAMRWSPRGMYYTATAGAAFFAHRTSDINAALTNGAFLANLWHGVGLKAIHLGHPKGLTSAAQRHRTTRFGRARYRTYLVVPDIVATTSDFMQAHFAVQFQLPVDRCPKLGYPRVDCALDDALWTMATKLDSQPDFALTPDGFSEAYIYLPTSRDSNRPLLAPALPDLSRLSGALAKRRALFYIKLHPRTRESVPNAYDNIRAWPTSIDIQSHLHRFDLLITDYSSVLYDFIATRSTGVILYTYDLSEYLSTDRDLLYPFDENTAGLRVHSFHDLCVHLERGTGLKASDEQQFCAVRSRFWGDPVTLSSPRVARYVAERIGVQPSIFDRHGAFW